MISVNENTSNILVNECAKYSSSVVFNFNSVTRPAVFQKGVKRSCGGSEPGGAYFRVPPSGRTRWHQHRHRRVRLLPSPEAGGYLTPIREN